MRKKLRDQGVIHTLTSMLPTIKISQRFGANSMTVPRQNRGAPPAHPTDQPPSLRPRVDTSMGANFVCVYFLLNARIISVCTDSDRPHIVQYTVRQISRRLFTLMSVVIPSCVSFQCSLSVCHKTRTENARSVEEFAAKIAAHGNATFLCYYDTETLDNAILEKLYSKMDVFHYLFWPSLIIVICGLVFLHAECHRKGMVVSPCGKAASPPSPLASPSAASSAAATAAESSSLLLDGNVVRETKETKKDRKTKKESRLAHV